MKAIVIGYSLPRVDIDEDAGQTKMEWSCLICDLPSTREKDPFPDERAIGDAADNAAVSSEDQIYGKRSLTFNTLDYLVQGPTLKTVRSAAVRGSRLGEEGGCGQDCCG